MQLNWGATGKTEKQKNELIKKVLAHLNEVDFEIENDESDILGDAYEYLIGQRYFNRGLPTTWVLANSWGSRARFEANR